MNPHLPTLYTFRRCPYAMRARMAICVAGIHLRQIEVSLNNKPKELLECSPKGTVPVVITADGSVIEQSRDIMMWALQQADPENWLLHEHQSKHQEMMQLVDIFDIEFKPLLDRYKYFDRYPESPQTEYRRCPEVFLTILNRKLCEHAFLVDEKMRFADVAIFPFIRQFAAVDHSWFAQSPYKNLQRWLETCVTTKLFETIMEKNQQ